MKIAVVTDSTSYLSKEEIDKYNIHVIPIPVVIDGRSYDEGIDITTANFWDKLRNSKSFPSTSQPPVGKMISLYRKLANEGYDTVISIHLASTIAGMLSSLESVSYEVKDEINVVVYDSQITVKLMGYLAIEAAKMISKGADITDIVNRLDQIRKTIDEIFVVDDLQNLVRGGRLSNSSAFIGNILKIKPLLTFDANTHKIVAFEKVRSRKKALKRVEELFTIVVNEVDYPLRALVINGNDPQSGDSWMENIHYKFPGIPIEASFFGPVIGTHLGEKALALAWMLDTDRA